MEANPRPDAENEELFNPFPGLRPFHTDEDHLFFGRDRETDELLRRLRTNRFVSVLGTSGSGKSSLVRSGLIPSLYGGFLVKAGSTWRVAILRPGEDPIGNLASALNGPEVLGSDREMADTNRILLETTLRRSAIGLAECVRHAHLPPNENVLVVVDQFEELFRFKDSRKLQGSRDEAVAFSKLLVEAAGQEEPVYVAITMRSDFIGECMEYPGLPEAVNQGQYLIPRMTREELRSAIAGPVAVGGGTIAPRLVMRLLNEMGDDPDQLPVLQHALMRTWDHWTGNHEGGEPLDVRHYEAIGTMANAMSLHAEEAFAELRDDRARGIAERLFKALTDQRLDNRGVRRPTPVQEMAAIAGTSEAQIAEIVEVFRRRGRSFLMPPPGVELTAESILDISHESLMRCWKRLAEWVDEETASGKSYRHLCRAARRYGRGEGSLWGDPELSIGLRWREESRPTPSWARRYDADFEPAMAFLDESAAARSRRIEEEERERRAKLRRARGLAAVLGSAALVTLAFGLYALYAGMAARRAERVALEEARTARAVSGFLVDLFGIVDPEEAQGNSITAREILDKGAKKIDAGLSDQPAVRARLMMAIGKVYGNLGLYEQAEPLLDKARETARTTLGADAPETLEAMDRLARIYQERGRYSEAEKLYGQVLEARRRVLGADAADTLRSLSGLSEVFRSQDLHLEAERTAREAMDGQRRVLGEEHPDTLRSMSVLAVALAGQGKYGEAEPLLLKAWKIQQRKLGDDHPDTLASLGSLGQLYTDVGRYGEAETLYEKNLEDQRRVFGDDHPRTLAALDRLAQLDLSRGRWKESEVRRLTVLETRRRVLGKDHPSTLESMGNLAALYQSEARLVEADRLSGEAYDKASRVLGEEHPKTLRLAAVRTTVILNLGRYDLAEKLGARTLEISRRIYGEAHPFTLRARNQMAVVYDRWGQREKRNAVIRENFEIARRALGDEHPSTLLYMRNLVLVLNGQALYEEAEKLSVTLVETSKRVLGKDNPQTFSALDALASIYWAEKRFEEAERLLRESLDGRRRLFGGEHTATLGSLSALSDLFGQLGRFREAEPLRREVLETRRRVLGEEHPWTIGATYSLAWLYAQMNDPARQISLLSRALSNQKQIAGRQGATAEQKIAYANGLIYAPQQLQNPQDAIRFAREANEMSGWKNREFVAALAEAFSRAGKRPEAIETIKKAIAQVPEDDTDGRNWLGSRLAEFYRQGGDTGQKRSLASEKLARLKESATKAGTSPAAKNEYAFALMTADPPELRDVKEALKIALEANEMTGFKQADLLDSLAIAYHLSGQQKQAIETETKALSLVPKNEVWTRQNAENHLAIFQGGGRPDKNPANVLQGTWSGRLGPLNVKAEFRREGQYIAGVNLSQLPWMPVNVTWYRMQVDTGRFENQVSDSGWTNPHFVPADHLLTANGDLILWNPLDWGSVRLHRD